MQHITLFRKKEKKNSLLPDQHNVEAENSMRVNCNNSLTVKETDFLQASLRPKRAGEVNIIYFRGAQTQPLIKFQPSYFAYTVLAVV